MNVRKPSDIRNNFLRAYRMGLIDRGNANPNVSPGSEIYALADSLANELAVLDANAVVSVDARMPDTAQGDDVISGAKIYGVNQRPASPAFGFAILSCTATTTITVDSQLVSEDGLVYAIVTPGIYEDGDYFAIMAVDTGISTVKPSGSVLRWVTAPPFAESTCLVGETGLRDGGDKEDIEEVRNRWIDALSNPPSPGKENPAGIMRLAEDSHPAVQKAFAYPAIYGTGTCHVAVTGRTTDEDKTRIVSSAIVSGYVEPAIASRFMDNPLFVVTSVRNVSTDIALELKIPSSPAASPPGRGGGWLDAQPWPTPLGSGGCWIQYSLGVYTIQNAANAPIAGATRVFFIDSNWNIQKATVMSFVNGGSGDFVCTFDIEHDVIPNSYVSPQCERQEEYLAQILKAFSLLGPGEMKNAPGVYRSYRHPRTNETFGHSIDAEFEFNVMKAGSEVSDVNTYYASTTTPDVPTMDPTLGPKVLVPRYIGIYPK